MNEIKFRGKRVDNGKWVYGYYFQKQNPFSVDGLPITHYISNVPPFYYVVDPETVGQYTGMKDGTKWEELSYESQIEWLKHDTAENFHGIDIYEGDIVKFEDTESEYVDVDIGGRGVKVAEIELYNWAEVVKKNGCFGLDIQGSELYENRFIDFNELIESWNEKFFQECKIIANVHDSPDFIIRRIND